MMVRPRGVVEVMAPVARTAPVLARIGPVHPPAASVGDAPEGRPLACGVNNTLRPGEQLAMLAWVHTSAVGLDADVPGQARAAATPAVVRVGLG